MPSLAVFDGVSAGTVEMGHTASLFWVGKMPVAPVFCTVPFGLTPGQHMSWLVHGGQKLWDELYAPAGVKAFVGGNTGASAGGWFRKEIASLADIKGLRIRATGLSGEIYAALGATAIVIPPGETYAALEKGVIDAVELLAPVNDLPLGLHKIAPHYLFPGFNKPNGASELLIGEKAWASLPPHLHTIIETACHAEHEIALAEAESANAAALGKLVAAGAKPGVFPEDVIATARVAAAGALDRIAGTSSARWQDHRIVSRGCGDGGSLGRGEERAGKIGSSRPTRACPRSYCGSPSPTCRFRLQLNMQVAFSPFEGRERGEGISHSAAWGKGCGAGALVPMPTSRGAAGAGLRVASACGADPRSRACARPRCRGAAYP